MDWLSGLVILALVLGVPLGGIYWAHALGEAIQRDLQERCEHPADRLLERAGGGWICGLCGRLWDPRG